jgi:hypothetical protein
MENITNFLYNKRHQYIRYDSTNNAFKVTLNPGRADSTEIRLPGLTSFMREVFYPDYVYVRKSTDGTTGVSSMKEGMERGTKVHLELMEYFNNSKKDFLQTHKDLQPYTAKVITAIDIWELKPLCGEICVFNKDWATRIDAIMTDSKFKFIVADWKCGMDDYFERGNAPMKGPLAMFSNCPKNQAFVQVLLTMALVEEYGVKVDEGLVINVNKSSVKPCYIPKEMLELKDIVYKYFNAQVRIIKLREQAIREQLRKQSKGKRKSGKSYSYKKKGSQKKRPWKSR